MASPNDNRIQTGRPQFVSRLAEPTHLGMPDGGALGKRYAVRSSPYLPPPADGSRNSCCSPCNCWSGGLLAWFLYVQGKTRGKQSRLLCC